MRDGYGVPVTWRILHGRAGHSEAARFFLASGLLTALLLFDDLFLLHEFIYPRYLRVPETLVYAVYLFLVVAWLIRYRARIFSHNFIFLFTAVACLGLSVALDVWHDKFQFLPQLSRNWAYLLEHGFKLLGISGWCGYFVCSACHETLGLAPGGVYAPTNR